MIARIWRGRATVENAPHYEEHVTARVFPSLASLPGHQGGYLLRRESEGEVEFLALTMWDSLDAIKRFTGANPDVAVVEPEARAILSSFDDFARHYRVANAVGSAAPRNS